MLVYVGLSQLKMFIPFMVNLFLLRISFRYLLKNQHQKQHHDTTENASGHGATLNTKGEATITKPVKSPSPPAITVAAKSPTTSPQSLHPLTRILPKAKEEKELPPSPSFKPIGEIATSPVKVNSTVSASQFSLSAAQMAVEMLKIKQKKAAFTQLTRCNSTNANADAAPTLSGSSQNLFTVSSSSNYQQLHSHHTESSLNKQKLKQAQPLPASSASLKRTPSVTSLLKNNEPTTSSSSLSNSSSSSLKQNSVKSVTQVREFKNCTDN